jgi:hypothetical protein
VAQTDFYLASSGLIPLLAIAPVVAKEFNIVMPIGREAVVDRLNRIAPRLQLISLIAFSLFYAWAEFICLRSLEIGRSTFGGPLVIWIALLLLTIQIAVDWLSSKLPDAFPNHFPPQDDTKS